MNPTNDHVIVCLDSLRRCCTADEAGLRRAARHLPSGPLRRALEAARRERVASGRVLREVIERLGGRPTDGKAALGVVRHGWLGLAHAVASGSPRQIAAEAERSAAALLGNFEEALAELPDDHAASETVREQHAQVEATHAGIAALRKRRPGA